MRIIIRTWLTSIVLFTMVAFAHAAVLTYMDETAYLEALSTFGYSSIIEDFEGAAWDSVRSDGIVLNAAKSITSNSITWTSSDRVTTGTAVGRTGYGIFSYVHGIPDTLTGSTAHLLYGIGGWFYTNTPPAQINIILDNTTVVDFNDPILGTQYQFLGLITTDGFKTFEIREIEGTVGDQKFIFADDFTFGTLSQAQNPLLNPGRLETNVTGPPSLGQGIAITITASAQAGLLYYKWYSQSGFGTPNPGAWQLLADWSINNNVLTWSPGSDSRYVVLAHIAESAGSTSFHQAGLTFETLGNSANPIQITAIVTDLTYPQPSGIPITFNATAAGGSGPLFYKYFYRLGNGPWNAVGAWSTNSDVTWTPPQAGFYTVVVHVSDDDSVPGNPLNQGGMTITIGD